MKKELVFYKVVTIVLSIIVLSIFFGISVFATGIKNYQVVAENRYLKLYLHSKTTEFAMENKLNGDIWYSNPFKREEMEKKARGKAKKMLNSQFKITYFTPADVQKTLDNYSDSVAYGQYKITKLNDGVRIDYQLGQKWDEDDYLPLFIGQSKYTSMIENIKKTSDKKLLNKYYHLVKLVYNPANTDGFSLNDYSLIEIGNDLSRSEKSSLYEIFITAYLSSRDDIRDRSKIKRDDLKGFTKEPIYMLGKRKQDILAWDKADMIKLIKKTAYNPEDSTRLCRMFNMTPPEPNKVIFTVPIEYHLDDDNFIVKIPVNDIKYPTDVINEFGNKEIYPLVAIEVLPFFGAGYIEDNGYMFIPDGSGSIINFSNGKLSSSPYDQPVYGRDYSKMLFNANVPKVNNIHLPVYGLKKCDQAFFTIIEEGDAIANICSDIAGRKNSYNTIYPKFNLIPYTTAGLQASLPEIYNKSAQWVGGASKINVYQARMYQGDIKLRYAFLNGKDANYTGMAKYYQQYLVDKYNWQKLKTNRDSIPFLIEIIAAIEKEKPVMGVPIKVIESLTTYHQTKDILAKLMNSGINNIDTIYSGWLKGGIKHIYSDKVYLEDVGGSKNEFADLIKYTNKQNMKLFPKVNFMNIQRNNLFDGFNVSKDSARFLNRSIAQYDDNKSFDIGSDDNKVYSYIISPARLNTLSKEFINDYSKYQLDRISLEQMGIQLNSDYCKNNLIDRQQAKNLIENVLREMSNKIRIQVSGGNAYVLPYVKSVIDMPISGSNFDIVDKDIPFMQIVCHGFIEYTGKAINYQLYNPDYILKFIEIGANPYFKVYAEHGSAVKRTDYDYLFTGYDDLWFDNAIKIYQKINSALKYVQAKEIIKHEEVIDNVYRTTYENGIVITVNYNDLDLKVNGVIIKAHDFRINKRENTR